MGVEKKNWHQWTENYPRFPWICSLTPKDHLRPLQVTICTDEFQNFTEISTNKLCLIRWLDNVNHVQYDLIAFECVPYRPF